MQYCQVVNTIPAHDDAVSCMSYLDRMGFLITGSWDSTVKLWKGFTRTHAKSFRLGDSILAYFTCDDYISCLDSRLLTESGKINVLIGTAAGNVFIWSIDQIFLPMDEGNDLSSSNVFNLTKTQTRFSKIRGLQFNRDGTKIACCDSAGRLVVYFVHNVNEIKQDNIVVLFEKDLKTELTCLNWSLSNTQLIVADAQGVFYVWNMAVGKVDKEEVLHTGTITGICCLDVATKRFITAGAGNSDQHCIKIWKCENLAGT